MVLRAHCKQDHCPNHREVFFFRAVYLCASALSMDVLMQRLIGWEKIRFEVLSREADRWVEVHIGVVGTIDCRCVSKVWQEVDSCSEGMLEDSISVPHDLDDPC